MNWRLWLARARYAARRLDPLDVLAAGLFAGVVLFFLTLAGWK